MRGYACLSSKYGHRSKHILCLRRKTRRPTRYKGRLERLCGDARQHQAFAAKLTPGGGLLESGTKKSGDSGWLGSTRWASKSVTPSPARNVSSIRNRPVKLLAGFVNIR